MKRLHGVLLAVACCLCLSRATVAQLGGMNMFSKPNIADIFTSRRWQAERSMRCNRRTIRTILRASWK